MREVISLQSGDRNAIHNNRIRRFGAKAMNKTELTFKTWEDEGNKSTLMISPFNDGGHTFQIFTEHGSAIFESNYEQNAEIIETLNPWRNVKEIPSETETLIISVEENEERFLETNIHYYAGRYCFEDTGEPYLDSFPDGRAIIAWCYAPRKTNE